MTSTSHIPSEPSRPLRSAKPSDPSLGSSAATLIGCPISANEPTTTTSPSSPFSASFDPNLPTPPLLQTSNFHSFSQAFPPEIPPRSTARAGGAPNNVVWANRLSSSFNVIAEQLNAASRALASIEIASDLDSPVRARSSAAISEDEDMGVAHADTAGMLVALSARLDAVEKAQETLGEDLEAVKAHLERLHVQNGKELEISPDGAEVSPPVDVEALKKTVDRVVEGLKLNQAQMYARLQNSRAIVNKMPIMPLVMANGKPPQNFPNTKGEFEHLTKERYEHLLKSYGLPIKGDTAAKREAVREFLGLPS